MKLALIIITVLTILGWFAICILSYKMYIPVGITKAVVGTCINGGLTAMLFGTAMLIAWSDYFLDKKYR